MILTFAVTTRDKTRCLEAFNKTLHPSSQTFSVFEEIGQTQRFPAVPEVVCNFLSRFALNCPVHDKTYKKLLSMLLYFKHFENVTGSFFQVPCISYICASGNIFAKKEVGDISTAEHD